MWFFLSNVIAASVLTILQVSFFSRLPAPMPDISFPLIAITWAVVSDEQLAAMLWALVAGAVLGLHGVFGFGTDIAILFAIAMLERVLFIRFLSNRSTPAVFLLAAAGALTAFVGLLFIDGVRTIFGQVPYFISQDFEGGWPLARSVVVNGAIASGLVALTNLARKRLRSAFLPMTPER